MEPNEVKDYSESYQYIWQKRAEKGENYMDFRFNIISMWVPDETPFELLRLAKHKRNTTKHVNMVPQRLTEHHFLIVMLDFRAEYKADGSFELHKEERGRRSAGLENMLGVVV